MREENLLLAYLPDEERERLTPYLHEEVLEFQQVLIEPNQPITDLYFPYDAITSTIQEMNDGDSVETGLMGIEGFVGVQLWLHAPTTSTRHARTGSRQGAPYPRHGFHSIRARCRVTAECTLCKVRSCVPVHDVYHRRLQSFASSK